MATPIALQNFLTQSSPQFSSRMTPYDFATTAGSTALGIGNNARAMRQLEEQLALAEKDYENMISEQEKAKQLALFNLGAGTTKERKDFINEYSGGLFSSGTGYDIGISKSPLTTESGTIVDLLPLLKASNYAQSQSDLYGSKSPFTFGYIPSRSQAWGDISSGVNKEISNLLNQNEKKSIFNI